MQILTKIAGARTVIATVLISSVCAFVLASSSVTASPETLGVVSGQGVND